MNHRHRNNYFMTLYYKQNAIQRRSLPSCFGDFNPCRHRQYSRYLFSRFSIRDYIDKCPYFIVLRLVGE